MMMALWQTRTFVGPLLTLHIALLFPHASFGVAVKCWWRRVSSVSDHVSIECQADPQGSMLECDLCHVHILPLNPAGHVSQTGCSHMSASFSTLMDANAMQDANCTLLCPGHTPGKTSLHCMVQEGYPPPTCLIPYNDEARDIHCHWTGSLNRLIPTNFTLHWKEDDENGYCGYIDVGASDSGVIPRANYSAYEYINIWVSAANTFGKIDSETLSTHTHSIIQPATLIISHNLAPLEIDWDVLDQADGSGQWQCKVQYKKQCEEYWTEDEDTYEVSFSLEDAVPFTTYKFRVRCSHVSDERAVMSDWSPEYTAETPAATPVGTLDVWSDCESTSDESSCTILWKDMPKQQARGNISNYVVTMKLRNGSVFNINGSVYMSAETCAQCGLDIITKEPSHAQQSYLACAQEQQQGCFHYCHLSVPVKEVKGIEVTAKTTVGESAAALVALPRAGLRQPVVALEVKGKNQELTVSWSVLHPFSDSVQEYVVQHKPVGQPDTPCLHWVKVPNNQTSVTLRGRLSNYTAYTVSLFAIANNHSCLLKSVIAYTVEGVPPVVTGFQAIAITSSSANLTWTPIPLNASQGFILQYLLGFNNDVYNVSSNQSSFQLPNLSPDQEYKVWISAKTSAGEGERVTTPFTTTATGNIATIVVVIVTLVVILPFLLIVLIVKWCLRAKLTKKVTFYKIPDPINSSSFKQMSNQFWHSWPVPPASTEYGLTISQVEVVPKPEVNHEPEVEEPEEHREDRGKDLRGLEGLERDNPMLRRQKEYSQMIDGSDEEDRDDEDEEWNEQPSPSDYEKHFIPFIVDV